MINSISSIQKGKLKILRKEGLYRSFPFDKVLPTVSKYLFRNKTDRYFLDFYYSTSLLPDPDFIPATTYQLYVEPALNDARYAKSISDKALYEKVLIGIKTPKTILRKINKFYYNQDYHFVHISDEYINAITSSYDKLLLKASVESGGGMNIRMFLRENNTLVNGIEPLNTKTLSGFPDFILQEVIIQHEFLKRFNPSSNNTLRILTYKSVKNNEIHVLHSLLRIGQQGSFMDHDNLGGIVVGISAEGILNNFGCNVNGIKFSSFNGINFSEIKGVPFIDVVKAMAITIADQIYYGRLLAIDFSVDRNGNPLMLEINCYGNGICQYQMNNGSLFMEFTKEILDYCEQHKTKYMLKI